MALKWPGLSSIAQSVIQLYNQTGIALALLVLFIYGSQMSKSKTNQAVEYMKMHGVTARAAAKQFGISPSAVYRAIKNLEETANNRCPTCGHLVKSSR